MDGFLKTVLTIGIINKRFRIQGNLPMKKYASPVKLNLNNFFVLALLLLLSAGILIFVNYSSVAEVAEKISSGYESGATSRIGELKSVLLTTSIIIFAVILILFVCFCFLISKIKKEDKERGELESAHLKRINELEELNKNKDLFYSIIAHDLRSPFQPILTLAEILHGDYKALRPEEIKEFGSKLNNVGRNVLVLLDNLLDWTKVQTGRMVFNPEPFLMKEKAEWAINNLEMIADAKKVIMLNDLDENIWIYADLNMILSVLQNLLTNSIKFTRPGGMIKVSGEQSGGMTVISISDNGVGMTDAQKETLFKIGVNSSTAGTSGEKGSGLGLLLCNKLIEMHGGTLKIESNKGKGTKVSFTIPDKLKEK